MPSVQLPKVKLGFLRRLLLKRSDHGAIAEFTTNNGLDTEQDEKAAVRAVPLEECPICHDPVGVKNPEGILESWVHLHCNHKFGTHCIQTWLQESAERDPHSLPSCPICRITAKHPCGHLIVLPAPRVPPITAWSMIPPLPVPSSSTHIESRRPRRRLSRRWGHPHRPPPPPPIRAHVQTVGECATCATAAAAAAAREKRMKQLASPIVEPAGTAHSGRGRAGIKYILLQTNFRGRSNSFSESPRGEDYGTSLGLFSEHTPPAARPLTAAPRDSLNLSLTAHRDSLTLCRTERGIPRSPTPVPPVGHVLSTRIILART